ncbi:EPIDERMAL PATTERNING FACTOR-like protein 8 isoform X2 [Cucumis melo]|uniref:Epidermal patterning factor-like protein n=1 Tax=Cucumis melo TaxID=3656 RepID=A0ABM3KIH0_CUCME|nr:EPIDERMAL PATTERNING FACTOR-like protein 8 isoform X2 [Cucumis melo]
MALKHSLLLILPLLFSLFLSHPTSGHEQNFSSSSSSSSKQKELVIGSRPPQCFNKCLNCKPCVAALVISQRHNNNNNLVVSNLEADLLPVPEDDAYYLLSWKCLKRRGLSKRMF